MLFEGTNLMKPATSAPDAYPRVARGADTSKAKETFELSGDHVGNGDGRKDGLVVGPNEI